ncbi:hypothetical protein LOK46_26000 [Methylobacterium sp. NMS14P]|uniref:hypothetical protein n=1 Tax=Methylobacterium sp. NMS14P TaxID=2894310 RepID=UPI002358CAF7|nr:hypothetical protein [Methylobacterium sp. NMS14P]WCS24542.1 hypothetical protein LOK46_26000 [Methylobacterium sp. NMS14P]
MRLFNLLRGAAALTALTTIPAAALAQEGGPCTDAIAQLRRDMGNQVGMGAPTSEPDYGQRKGPENAASQQTAGTAGDATGSTAKPVGTPDTDRAQKGGASRESGGTPGTVGGVSGPVGAASGMGQADDVASGRIATSPADVRRQSENRPTAAAAAAQGGDAKASPGLASEDKVSQAKTALQRAVDLNAKGDQSCRDAVQEARNLLPKSDR